MMLSTASVKIWLSDARRDARLFLIYNFIFHVSLLGITDVLLNFYFVSLGHDQPTISLLQALPRLAGFITSVPISLMANRLGTQRLITWSSLGIFVAFLPLFVSPTLPMLALNRLLVGFFYGAQQIALSPLMMQLVEPEEHTRFFALHNVVSMMGMAVGSLVGGALPAIMMLLFRGIAPEAAALDSHSPLAYGAALFVSGIILVISVWPMLLMTRQHTASAPADQGAAPPRPRPWLRLLWLTLPMILFGFSGGLTFPFYNLFFRAQFGQPDQNVGFIMSIGWVGMALVPLLNPYWEGRFGRAKALGLTMTIASVAFLALSLAVSLPVSILAYTIAISFRNVMQPLFQPLMLGQLPDELRNVGSGMSMVLWNIGWFSATAMSGTLQTNLGFAFIFQLTAVTVLLAGLGIVWIFRAQAPI